MHIFTYKDHSLVIDRPVLVSFFKSELSALIHWCQWRSVAGDEDSCTG